MQVVFILKIYLGETVPQTCIFKHCKNHIQSAHQVARGQTTRPYSSSPVIKAHSFVLLTSDCRLFDTNELRLFVFIFKFKHCLELGFKTIFIL